MPTRRATRSFAIVLAACVAAPATAAPRDIQTLAPPARQLFEKSLELAAASFDPQAHLLRSPPAGPGHDPGLYLVRESTWYALGLLARDHPGDRATAAAILETVLAQQYQDPSAKWYGTFRRSPEEALPAAGTVAFTGYDPNWRHFIGTTFQIILERYPTRIPPALIPHLYASIDTAIAGEIHDGRLKESYSNIALMYGALWDFAADHDHNPQWLEASARWNQTVFNLFRQHNTFSEFNSPTYYGTDLYGLALWRSFGSTPAMRRMGATMQSTLWNDIADFYQPSLRNIAGPYDRSYGMDMESYVAVTGMWLRTVLPAHQAPLPETLTLDTDHIADIFFAPQIALLGARIPPAALRRFTRFAGPHLVTRPIDSQRIATAYIGGAAIWGGESTSFTRGVDARSQFHPATLQWRTPGGSIGWINLILTPPLNAVASRDGIAVTLATPGDLTFRIAAQGATPAALTAGTWNLPGMTIHASAQSDGFTVTPATLLSGQSAFDLTYRNARRITLAIAPALP